MKLHCAAALALFTATPVFAVAAERRARVGGADRAEL